MITHHHQSIHFITPIESNDGILMIEWNQQQQKTIIIIHQKPNEFNRIFLENKNSIQIGKIELKIE